MTKEYVGSFIDLIEKFLKKSITALDFEEQFLILWHKDISLEDAFEILDWLFFQVDAYTDLPIEPTDNPDDYINEDQLRESATKTLQELAL